MEEYRENIQEAENAEEVKECSENNSNQNEVNRAEAAKTYEYSAPKSTVSEKACVNTAEMKKNAAGKDSGRGTETASFVLSVGALMFLACIPFIGVFFAVICAILGICLGAQARKEKSSLANAGFIISVVSLVLSVAAAVIFAILGNAILNAVVYFINQSSSPFGFNSPFYMFP